MKEGYSVTVSKWGEPILTIEPNMIAGAELSDEDARAIWIAGEHLKSFVGDPDSVISYDFPGDDDLVGVMADDNPLVTVIDPTP